MNQPTSHFDHEPTMSSKELSCAPGVTTRFADVTRCSDLVDGGNERFRVKLSSPTNATISDDLAVGTITDDDHPFLTINNVAVAEPALGQSAQVAFTIQLHAIVPDHNVTVHYQTANGTAHGGASCLDEAAPDDVSESGTATILAGQAARTITIQVCGNGSQLGGRTFTVQLSTASNGVPITDATGTGTIGGLPLPLPLPLPLAVELPN